MKKILILFLFITFPLALKGLTGSGTYGSPYSGTFNSAVDPQWNFTNFPGGKIYINGDVTIDNELLTIEAGMTIIFLAEGADLIITGTGQLNASGSSGSKITFTADDDDNGTYGESGERWGHISFQSMGSAGSSSITFCIIEYGRKDGTLGTLESVGGGLHVDFNSITISDNTFRNNYAFFGGAVFINTNRNPSITRCIFRDNSVREAGGAVYLYNSCSSLISNCIFDGNYSKGQTYSYYSGGGIQFGLTITTAKVVNSVFVNNTSDRTGDSFYTLSGGSVVNSILWGTSDQTGFYTSSGTVEYSAIQGYSAGSHFSNCFNLNSSDTDPAGPNFTNLSSHDFSIKLISPCRNAGTSSGAPATDYLGNNRIGNYDIGAYEVQYNGWKTTASTTDWSTASNWDQGSVPGSSTNVVIPTGASNYPVGSSYTIGSGYGMVLEPGAHLTMPTLTTSGDLKLKSDASNISSLITNSGVNAIVEIYLSGGGSPDYKWHYISSPVASLSTDVFTGATLNLAQFVESRPSLSLLQGWVAFDGYEYYGGTSTGITFSSLTVGQGYNYYDATNNTFTFSGSLNTSDVVKSLSFTSIPSMHGFNLLGNPFSSGLDWDDIADGIYFSYPASTSKGVYFTRDNSQCTYIGGVGTPGDVTGIIPPMQGFFTKTYSTGNSITLAAAARTHDAVHARYKGKGTIPLVRLSIFEDTVSGDETVVRFDELAKTDLDNDFDAIKMFLSSSKTTIHSKTGETDYAINGQPFPETFVEIPVIVNMISTGNHKISAIQLQGLEDYNVTLTDNSTGFIADLKTMPDLIFSSPAGLITDRFVLKITNIATAIEIPVTPEDIFNIYHGYGLINIQPLADDWEGKMGSVKVFDLAGKTIADLHNTQFTKNSVIQVQAPDAKGLYIVEIKSGVKRHLGKVVVK